MNEDRENFMQNTILIVDDEKEITELLELYMESDGYKILKAYDGLEALEKIKTNQIDLAVVDIMMPKLDGFGLVKRLRQELNIPVILLSAKSTDNDKILGLNIGADDYITKPFNPLEVKARISAQLRRYYSLNKAEERKVIDRELVIGELKLDKEKCLLFKRGEEVTLTYTEFKILSYLMENAGKVLTKKQIYEYVWEDPYFGDDNTIMVHMSNLRDKIEPDSRKSIYLKTIRGLGYKFEARPKLD
jgi:DNA-binding response OmpR family regulator